MKEQNALAKSRSSGGRNEFLARDKLKMCYDNVLEVVTGGCTDKVKGERSEIWLRRIPTSVVLEAWLGVTL